MDDFNLAHVAITSDENGITTVSVNGEELQSVTSVSFSHKFGELPLLKLELICGKVAVYSPIQLHVPEVCEMEVEV